MILVNKIAVPFESSDRFRAVDVALCRGAVRADGVRAKGEDCGLESARPQTHVTRAVLHDVVRVEVRAERVVAVRVERHELRVVEEIVVGPALLWHLKTGGFDHIDVDDADRRRVVLIEQVLNPINGAHRQNIGIVIVQVDADFWVRDVLVQRHQEVLHQPQEARVNHHDIGGRPGGELGQQLDMRVVTEWLIDDRDVRILLREAVEHHLRDLGGVFVVPGRQTQVHLLVLRRGGRQRHQRRANHHDQRHAPRKFAKHANSSYDQ